MLSQFVKNFQFYQNATNPSLKVDIFLLFLSFPHFVGAQFGERQGIFKAKARTSTLSILHALCAKFELKDLKILEASNNVGFPPFLIVCVHPY